MDFITNLLTNATLQVFTSFLHNWPFLVISVLISVALKLYVDPVKISALLTRYRRVGVIGATVAAVTTPLCSCGTTAVVLGMMASLIPWAPIIAFMVASPLTSPEELIYSAGLFGWPFALAFFVSSIVLGLMGGLAGEILERRGWLANQTRFTSPAPKTTAQAVTLANIAPSQDSKVSRRKPQTVAAPLLLATSAAGSAASAGTIGLSLCCGTVETSTPVEAAKAGVEKPTSTGCGYGSAPVQPPAASCGCGSVPAETTAPSCGCSSTTEKVTAPSAASACSCSASAQTAAPSTAPCSCDSSSAAAAPCACSAEAVVSPVAAQPARVTLKAFLTEAFSTGKRLLVMFLGFAFIGYLLNGLIPAAWVTALFGQGNVYSVPLAATFGLPFYINTEGSLPLVRALIDGGMSQGAALAFLITGAGTSIGAVAGALTIARWRVIAVVIGTLWAGAVLLGYLYNALLLMGLF